MSTMHLYFHAGVAVATSILTLTLLSIYGLWPTYRVGETVAVYEEGPTDQAYDLSSIRSVIALDADGETVRFAIEPHEKRVKAHAGAEAVIFPVEGDMGILSQDDEGHWRKGAKLDVPGGKITLQFSKYGVSVTHLHFGFQKLSAQSL